MPQSMECTFSILIPVYNQKEYLPYCIDSVLRQTIDDYEVILVDDGSTDGSSKLCEEYRRKYSAKIQVIHQANAGVFAARRRALHAAKGSYVLFLDGDDAYRPDALEVLLRTIEEQQAEVILYNASVTDDFRRPYGKAPFSEKRVFMDESKKEIYTALCKTHQLNSLCCKCIRRQLLSDERVDGTGAVFLGYGEDLYLSIPVLDKAKKIVFLKESLYFYRQHDESVTHTYFPWQLDSVKIVCERLRRYAAVWEEQYDVEFSRMVDHYCAVECYGIMKNIGRSHLSIKEKKAEIQRLKKDPFFRPFSYGLLKNRELNMGRKLLFMMLYSNNFLVLWGLKTAFGLAKGKRCNRRAKWSGRKR